MISVRIQYIKLVFGIVYAADDTNNCRRHVDRDVAEISLNGGRLGTFVSYLGTFVKVCKGFYCPSA